MDQGEVLERGIHPRRETAVHERHHRGLSIQKKQSGRFVQAAPFRIIRKGQNNQVLRQQCKFKSILLLEILAHYLTFFPE